MYEYYANLIDIHDGDTIHAEVLLGCDVRLRMTIRFAGINAPELSTPEGVTARQYVVDWFAQHAPGGAFLLHTIKDTREKYGRYLGKIYDPADQDCLNDDMVRDGQAVVYNGGARVAEGEN